MQTRKLTELARHIKRPLRPVCPMTQPIEIKGLFHIALDFLNLCPRKGSLVVLHLCKIGIIEHCVQQTGSIVGHRLRTHKGNDQVWLRAGGRLPANDLKAFSNRTFHFTRH